MLRLAISKRAGRTLLMCALIGAVIMAVCWYSATQQASAQPGEGPPPPGADMGPPEMGPGGPGDMGDVGPAGEGAGDAAAEAEPAEESEELAAARRSLEQQLGSLQTSPGAVKREIVRVYETSYWSHPFAGVVKSMAGPSQPWACEENRFLYSELNKAWERSPITTIKTYRDCRREVVAWDVVKPEGSTPEQLGAVASTSETLAARRSSAYEDDSFWLQAGANRGEQAKSAQVRRRYEDAKQSYAKMRANVAKGPEGSQLPVGFEQWVELLGEVEVAEEEASGGPAAGPPAGMGPPPGEAEPAGDMGAEPPGPPPPPA
jgi:hypothetical protein